MISWKERAGLLLACVMSLGSATASRSLPESEAEVRARLIGRFPDEKLGSKVFAPLRGRDYRVYAQAHNRVARSARISAAELEALHKAQARLRTAVDAAALALYEWRFSGDTRLAAAADSALPLLNELFPSYIASFGGAGVHLEENRSYWGSLSFIAQDEDARIFCRLPLPEEWLYMRPLSEQGGCYDVEKISVEAILRLKDGAQSLRSPYFKAVAKQRLDKFLTFAAEGYCVCDSYWVAKLSLDGINQRLQPHGLRLGANLTPSSHVYGERKCGAR